MKIYGCLICQDSISEIRRCIESVYPVVDEYIVMDGGSTDGTWELLQKYKDVYNLTLYQHKYDRQDNQRNRLLQKVPKDNWVVFLDQDEQLNGAIRANLRAFLKKIAGSVYKDRARELTLALRIKNINVMGDILHYDAENIRSFTSKIFYYDRNLHFVHKYHTKICYFESDENSNTISVPDDWAILHYAYLNPDRIENPRAKGREYRDDEWEIDKKKLKKLPKEWR